MQQLYNLAMRRGSLLSDDFSPPPQLAFRRPYIFASYRSRTVAVERKKAARPFQTLAFDIIKLGNMDCATHFVLVLVVSSAIASPAAEVRISKTIVRIKSETI